MSHVVVVDDGNGVQFNGIPTKPGELPGADSEEHAQVFVLFDGRDNGFGDSIPAVKSLKRTGENTFVAG